MDRRFEDLLEGPDFITTRFEDSFLARSLKALKHATGLVLMMSDVLIDWQKPPRPRHDRRAIFKDPVSGKLFGPPKYDDHWQVFDIQPRGFKRPS